MSILHYLVNWYFNLYVFIEILFIDFVYLIVTGRGRRRESGWVVSGLS